MWRQAVRAWRNIVNEITMDIDIKELIKTATENLNLKDFKGDVVAVKVVENEFGTIESGGIGVQNVYHGGEAETMPSTDNADLTDMDYIEFCHFIHPSVTDDKEKIQIHKEIENLVRSTTIPNICSYLSKMAGDSRILLPIEPTSALKELRRMGMPGEDAEGFKYKNFAKYYRR